MPTTEGIYTPTTVETWHSDGDYRAIEQQVINLSAALSQRQNNPR